MQSPHIPPSDNSSIDEKIAHESHIVYEFLHNNDKKSPFTVLLTFAKYNKHKVIPVIVCMVLLPMTGILAITVNEDRNKKPITAMEETIESMNENGIYGVSVEEYADEYGGQQDDSEDEDASSTSEMGNQELKEEQQQSKDTSKFNTVTDNSALSFSQDKEVKPKQTITKSNTKTTSNTTSSSTPQPTTLRKSLITVGSWNRYYKGTTAKMKIGIRSLSSDVDILGLQEFSSTEQRDALRSLVTTCSSCGYALFMPKKVKEGGHAPIVWKKDKFRLMASGNMMVYDGQRVEYAVGSTNAPARSLVWVKLKDRTTGHMVYLLNLHLIPGFSQGAKPHPDRPKRFALYTKHINALIDKLRVFKSDGTVFVSGDLNINYRTDAKVRHSKLPYQRLGEFGLYSNWRYLGTNISPTHGTAYIDYVFVNKNAKATPKSHKTYQKFGSDHAPVSMTVQLTN